jgi:hypothetical protein
MKQLALVVFIIFVAMPLVIVLADFVMISSLLKMVLGG